jgi:hypothetical protein
VHAKDRHHTRDTCSEQRQRIKGAFAHPQRSGTCLQRGGVEVAFLPWQMVMALGLGHLCSRADRPAVEVHKATLGRGMRNDHATTAPVAGFMRPGARRRIAHAELLRQGQGNAPLLQVRGAAAPRQGSLERSELLGQV